MAVARAAIVALAENEYRRLLYVAMTRAADRLVVCGSVGERASPLGCWYRLAEQGLSATGELTEEDGDFSDGKVRLGEKVLNLEPRDAASGPSNLFIRRHDVSIVPNGSGVFEGDVKHVRAFGPTQRADIVLHNGEAETLVEIDAPRDRDLKPGDVVSLQPRRYRLFPAGS